MEMERLAAILKTRLPGGERITAIRPTSDGFSNRTFLLDGADLVLRLPAEGEPLLAAFGVHDVVAQYRIMEEFSRTENAPPVPGAVLLETDRAVLGWPFFVMARLDCDPWGDFSRPDWLNRAEPAFRSRVSEEMVRTYAALHALAPLAAFGPPRSSRDELARWRDPIRTAHAPALAEAFEILLASAPADQPAVPCHGDAKMANLLWVDGRVAALVDYEMGFNGDPRWDLAALLQGLRSADGKQPLSIEDEDGFWGQARIVSEWQRRTGRSADRLGWFRAADRARYAALLVHGRRLWDEGRVDDARFEGFGAIADRLSDVALLLARQDEAGQ